MKRFITYALLSLTTFLLGCAGPAPAPEPGMQVNQH